MLKEDTAVQPTPSSWRSPHDLACAALALLSGLAVGWLDLHVTEVAVTIGALLAAGLLLGLLRPSAPWRWGVLIAVGLPIVAAVARFSGMRTTEPARFDVGVFAVAFMFALVGSYAGVLIRASVRGLTSGSGQ